MSMRQISLFEDSRLDLEGAIELSLASLREYGRRYRHWAVAYSGGKDSSATVTFTAWAIKNNLIPAPESLTVLYADTRMELEPLQVTAIQLLETLRGEGFQAKVVLPPIDDRFLVYMLGRGIPPSNNRTFRWCTPQIKVEPMQAELASLREQAGEKLLMITGVRLGESAARDQRIAVSCSKDSGECGQGWFQTAIPEAITDTLAPLLHWRLCHVYDWLYFEQDRHGYDVSGIASVYGEEDVRTGCVGCPLANRDTALERLIKKPEWEHLRPLLELKPLYRELREPQNRLRKSEPEIRKDGKISKNVQRLGPLTMEARAYGLETVLSIQTRARVDLINSEEESRIREMWRLNIWPEKWTGEEITGDVAIDAMRLISSNEIAVQSLLVR
jgi:DNA sulfur modification protein DndC